MPSPEGGYTPDRAPTSDGVGRTTFDEAAVRSCLAALEMFQDRRLFHGCPESQMPEG